MKKFTCTLLLLMSALLATAGPVSKQQALEKANAFLHPRGLQVASEPRHAPGQNAAEQQPLYVFNITGNHGFVIIAGDDRAETVLGYAEEGSYDEEEMPDNFRSWLEQTVRDINTLPYTEKMPNASQPFRVASHGAIGPLIKTKWDQGDATKTGYIYNTLTPTIDSKHCVTGCVATAGAQVMNYFQYPKNATKAVPSYYSNDILKNLPSLPAIKFNWANMKTTYLSSDVGTPSEKAVSQLMLYAGYAAEMDYGLDGSGASTYQLAVGMSELFDYDPYTWKYVSRDNYTVSDWDALIYGELQAKRPVIFSGSGTQGGHAYICDGYDGAGLYHFNWGWGGQYNGFFKLHATNPYNGTMSYSNGEVDNGFSMDVSAIIGLQPNTGQGSGGNESGEILGTAIETAVDGNVISALLYNENSTPAYLALGMAELKTNGTITMLDKSYEYFKNWELPSGSYWTSRLTFDVSQYGLSSGKHILVFASLEKNSNQWKRCLPSNLYYEVVVKNGSYTITQLKAKLQAKQFNFTGNKYAKVVQPVEVTIECQDLDYTEPLYFFASTSSSNKGNATYCSSAAIEAGQSETITFYFKPSKSGNYQVWVCTDQAGSNVVGTANVTINAAPTYTVSLSKVNISIDAGPKTTATVRVKNTSSHDYNETFLAVLAINNGNESEYVTEVQTPNFLIKAGETKDVTVTLNDLEPDISYNYIFCYKPTVGGSYNYLCDKDFSFTTPAATLGDVNMDGLVNVTDVTLIIERVLTGKDPKGYHHEFADINNDTTVNVTDVTLLINSILKTGN